MSVRIFKGINEPLKNIPWHKDVVGTERLAFLDSESIKGKSFHVAAHIVHENPGHTKGLHHVQPHSHEFDEINILVSEGSSLKYEMEFDGKPEIVTSPALVFIPAGTLHRAEAAEGSGIFLCIYMDQVTDKP